jgi:hypothetical protein
MHEIFERHAAMLADGIVEENDLTELNQTLRRLERFWVGAHDFPARIPRAAVSPAA